jgi:hypothetical protein
VDETQQRLLDRIERAFTGVELGDGVSLRETEVIDDYGSDQERLAARALDEKFDWRKLIDSPDLVRYCSLGYGGLCFFDAAGLRFHLPACLARAVKDHHGEGTAEMEESLRFQLTHLDEYQLDRLAILNDEQRACVRDVLVYFRERLDFRDEDLDRAIAGYWSQRVTA